MSLGLTHIVPVKPVYVATEFPIVNMQVSDSVVLGVFLLNVLGNLSLKLRYFLTDRTLQHIAKKGRPVSQCTHCRTLRKSRAAHVKCDCGEKAHNKATCTHGKETDIKGIPRQK